MERLYIFDTTLRDGAQTQGVSFSVQDKHEIALMLDKLGVDFIEGGWPGANPTDTRFFDDPPQNLNAQFVAFGMTARADRSAENDPALAAILNSKADGACLVAKSWDYHVKTALGIGLDENLITISKSIAAVKARGKNPMLDAEHFFDGFKANPSYALDCLDAAFQSGATWLVLCDTNGGTLPHEIYNITKKIKEANQKFNLGIHAHNDTGNGVANSLAAVQAGARQVQGTLNGLGERCGNANLVSLLPTFLLKADFADKFETGVSRASLESLARLSHQFDLLINRRSNRYAPYVGASAFAHKGGLHVSAVVKAPETYEHVPPASVGNQRQILVSNQAGRANLVERLQGLNLPTEIIPKDSNDHRLHLLLSELKQREDEGYTYEDAEASFALLAWKVLGELPQPFKINAFRVVVEKKENVLLSQATVQTDKDSFDGTGNGPVDALNDALRASLTEHRAALENMQLVDYKVRILNTSGTEAITRVIIENKNEKGERWRSVGISPNIVDASFKALVDGFTFHLLRASTSGATQ